jgi:RimJ/RimL family protein N-acetyltransferase
MLRAAVVYTNYSPGNVFATIAVEGRMNRRFLYAIFYNPFIAWGVRHITCAIEESNVRSLRLCTKMGFQQEGRLRESAVNGEDVIVMGMLKRECRFIQ